ncbi:hydroxyethylthiazole kinase [Brachybacterium sp. GCM10030252]|uniref:hydroxyethylthiazole kinase n=1 Tax=Brachybacterium sp. GCM10030252 TaxID=3273380 RepID=UPI00360CF1CC
MTTSTPENRLRSALEALSGHSPLVHCITNTVVQQITADVLLAIGAAPAMVDHAQEAPVFAAAADALLVNTGTVAEGQVQAMPAAARAARDAGRPWVLDPVAVGSLPVRTPLAHELLTLGPAAVRGNASEIAALAGTGGGGRGVDSTDTVEAVLDAARDLSARTGAVVAVSGERDAIVSAGRTTVLTSGDALLARVIGTGCALGATCAALLGSSRDTDLTPHDAVLAAHALHGAAGTLAARGAQGVGSFAVGWLDALDTLTPADVLELVGLQEQAAPA